MTMKGMPSVSSVLTYRCITVIGPVGSMIVPINPSLLKRAVYFNLPVAHRLGLALPLTAGLTAALAVLPNAKRHPKFGGNRKDIFR
jgi:hypothetical protein